MKLLSQSRLTSIAVIVLALSGGWASGQTKIEFNQIAPAETLLFMQIQDISELTKAVEKSPLQKLWNDEDFAGFLAPSKQWANERMSQLREQMGSSSEEIRQVFSGQVAFFLSDLIFTVSEDKFYQEINTGIIAEARGDKEKVRKLIEERFFSDLPRDTERKSEKFRGVTIYTTVFWKPMQANEPIQLNPDDPHAGMTQYHYEYALVDDLCILVEGQREYLKTIITNYMSRKEGRPGPSAMSETPSFQTARRRLPPDAQILAYANIERLLKQIENHPFALLFKQMPFLKLEEFRSAAMTARVENEGVRQDMVLVTSENPTGISRLLVGGPRNEFKAGNLIPANALSYTNCALPFADFWRFVRESSRAMNQSRPEAGIDGALRKITEMSQVDLERDLIDRLGNEAGLATLPLREGAPGAGKVAGTLAFVELRNDLGVKENLEKMVRGALANAPIPFKLESRLFQGVELYSIGLDESKLQGEKPAEDAPSFHFAVAQSLLLVSNNAETLESALRQGSGASEAPLPRSAAFLEATRRLDSGHVGVSWSDSKSGVPREALLLLGLLNRAGNLPEFVDPSQAPAPDILRRYFGSSVLGLYQERDALRVQEYLLFSK
jgi:hypothetical protein